MKILVTGASGYIGHFLIEELINHGHGIIALVRKTPISNKNVKIFKGDITNPEKLKKIFIDLDAVIHNAAYALDWGNKKNIYRQNVEGTRNIALLCSEFGIKRVVYTSSAGVYGFPNMVSEIMEDTPTKPLNAYQKSKLAGEIILQGYADLKVSIIRPPLVLGRKGSADQIIIKNIQLGKMRYVGEGTNITSIVHPKDVARCLRLALEKDTRGTVYNVISFTCRIKDLFNEISRQLNVLPPRKKMPYSLAYFIGFCTEYLIRDNPTLTRYRVKLLGTNRKISCKKAITELGYSPLYNLNTTVKDMVSHR